MQIKNIQQNILTIILSKGHNNIERKYYNKYCLEGLSLPWRDMIKLCIMQLSIYLLGLIGITKQNI